MPELPEVEAVVRRLKHSINGKEIAAAKLYWRKTFESRGDCSSLEMLSGSRITTVTRRGKFIVLNLADQGRVFSLLFHLRMSGNLVLRPKNCVLHKHDRASLVFRDGSELRFNDIRKFGRMYLARCAQDLTGDLGPEPLSSTFRFDNFYYKLRQKKGALKALLLNQRFIAGLGNIYADECLWLAKIHPEMKACSLSAVRARKLFNAIKQVLKQAIKSAGTNIGDNVVPEGQYRVRVYQRDGLKCHRCGSQIKRIITAQRGTHFCPACQRR